MCPWLAQRLGSVRTLGWLVAFATVATAWGALAPHRTAGHICVHLLTGAAAYLGAAAAVLWLARTNIPRSIPCSISVPLVASGLLNAIGSYDVSVAALAVASLIAFVIAATAAIPRKTRVLAWGAPMLPIVLATTFRILWTR